MSAKELENLGYNLVIYPTTTLRLAMGAIREGLTQLAESGTQSELVDKLLTRKELYELIHYEDYNNYDQSVYNFKI